MITNSSIVNPESSEPLNYRDLELNEWKCIVEPTY